MKLVAHNNSTQLIENTLHFFIKENFSDDQVLSHCIALLTTTMNMMELSLEDATRILNIVQKIYEKATADKGD